MVAPPILMLFSSVKLCQVTVKFNMLQDRKRALVLLSVIGYKRIKAVENFEGFSFLYWHRPDSPGY
jgi:hypothetical protein